MPRSHCLSFQNVQNELAYFKDNLLQPNFKKDCNPDQAPKECANYVSELIKQNKDWRSYLQTCEESSSVLKYGLSCLRDLEELGSFIGQSLATEIFQNQKDKDCSSKIENKINILALYNSRVPELLKYKHKGSIKNLMKKSCKEIEGLLSGYTKNMMQKITLILPQQTSDLSEAQKNYVEWRNSLVKNYQPEGPAWETIQKILANQYQNFNCMSSYRKTELSCRVLLTIGFGVSSVKTTSRALTETARQDRINALVQKELRAEKLAQEAELKRLIDDDLKRLDRKVRRYKYTPLQDPVTVRPPLTDEQKKIVSLIDNAQTEIEQQTYKNLMNKIVIQASDNGEIITGKLLKLADDGAIIQGHSNKTGKTGLHKVSYRDTRIYDFNERHQIINVLDLPK